MPDWRPVRVGSRNVVADDVADALGLDHVWWWRSRLPERKGEPCRVLARGRMNTILVEFVDGFRVTTSRYAVRRRFT